MTREIFDDVLGVLAFGVLAILICAASVGTVRKVQGYPLSQPPTITMTDTLALAPQPTGEDVTIAAAVPVDTTPTAPSRSTRRPTRTTGATRTPDVTPSPTMTRTPRPTRTPRATRTPRPEATPTLLPEITEVPTPRPSPTRFVPPTPVSTAHFWLQRPIGPNAEDSVAYFYPYGSTGDNTLQIHHGVEFVNPQGTQIIAAGGGRVVFAGYDDPVAVGPTSDFYGNVVVVQLDQTWLGQPVYTLYGHLHTIQVQEGQQVQAGDPIGLVGMTGIALGPHLHFEVRVGANAYSATRNPELWFPPHPGNGTIAGRVLNTAGERVPLTLVTLQRPDERIFRRASSYPNQNVNSDEELDENLLLGDVPAGRWVVAARVDGQVVIDEVTVREGEFVWVHLQPKPE